MDRFWKLRRSILEPSGFDFGESGSHFRMFWASLMQPRTPRNARNLPNNNSITNGWIAKGGWAAVTHHGCSHPTVVRRPANVCRPQASNRPRRDARSVNNSNAIEPNFENEACRILAHFRFATERFRFINFDRIDSNRM